MDDSPENTFVLRDSFNPIIKEFVVNDDSSLQDVANSIWNDNTTVDLFIVNITGNLSISPDDVNLFHIHYGNLIINGGGSVNLIRSCNKEYHFATVNKFSNCIINNLTINGFNCAIYNYGVLNLNNVIFSNNKIKCILEDDHVGAIYNAGLLNCYNCSFVNNSGNWAGVVYNCNGAESYFVLCDFVNNTHYKKDGADVYNFNYGNAFFVNGNSVQQKYGYPPSGVGYEARKACTYLISFGLGLTLSLNGCPGLGIFLGTFVGTALDVVNDLDYAKDNHHFSYSIFADMPKSLFMHFISSSIGSDLVKTNIKTVESPNQNKINPNINQKEPMADEFSTKSDLNNNINNQNEINPNIGENEPVVAEFSTKSDLNNNINNLNEREFNVKVSEKNINLEKEAADLKLNENKVVCEINGVKYYETDVLLRNGKEIVLSTGDGVSDFISYRYDDLDHLDMFEDKALNNFNSNHVGLNDYFEYQNTYQMLKYK